MILHHARLGSRFEGMFGFSLVWFGQFFSIVGSSMTRFGLTIWAWETTGRATALALVGLFSLIPMILLSPLAGALVDRWSRKKVMIFGDLVAGLTTGFLLTMFAAGRLEIWHIYLASVIGGAGEAFQHPAYMAAISTMIPKKHYGRAQGMVGMVGSATSIVAPVLAAALLAVIGVGGIMIVDISTFLFAVGMTLVVSIPRPELSSEGARARGSMLRESAFGFRFLLERRPLLYLLLAYACLNFVLSIASSIQAPMILARTDTNELILGTVQMFFGIGGVAGGVLLSIWGGPRRRIPLIFGAVILAMLGGPALLGIGRSLPFWAAGAFSLVFFAQLAGATSNVIWQHKVPKDVQGRVFAYRGMIASIASPLGMLAAGTLADYLFEPLMRAGGRGETLFGAIVGTGPGSGMGLMLFFAGLAGAVLGLSGFIVPAIRNLERLVPDADAAQETQEPQSALP